MLNNNTKVNLTCQLSKEHHQHDYEHWREVWRNLWSISSDSRRNVLGPRRRWRLLLKQLVLFDQSLVVALLGDALVAAIIVGAHGGDKVEAIETGLLAGGRSVVVLPGVGGVVRVDGAGQIEGEVQRNWVHHPLEVWRGHQNRPLSPGGVAGCGWDAYNEHRLRKLWC